MNIEKIWNNLPENGGFSGVFSVRNETGVIFERCCGFRSRSEKLPNTSDTAFGIASGTKLFTGLAVCRLIDEGKLSLNDKLWDILPFDLGKIDKRVTIFQLLTHTSGVGDYIDEEASDFEAQMRKLYTKYPVHLWERLDYYLPMITPLPPKFEPGARFGYSNAGFVLLGLVVEAVSGASYQQFVNVNLISPLNLNRTGFYRTDSLPANTATGYVGADAFTLRSNVFLLPVIGGADGGLYTNAEDLDTLWQALFSGRVLSENMLQAFLAPQVKRRESNSYGLGVYRYDCGNNTVFYAVGGDFGVDFFTAYFPRENLTASALGNSEWNTYPLLPAMLAGGIK